MSVGMLYRDANVFISLTIRRQLCVGGGGEKKKERAGNTSVCTVSVLCC